MSPAELPEAGPEGQQRQGSRDHRDRVEARPLPIAAPEVQPHPEFVEGQGQPDPIKDGHRARPLFFGPAEQQVGPDEGKQEYPEIQVMDVCAADVDEHVRQPMAHDLKYHDPQEGEGDQKSD
ncbi:MAG TPA: hypothetical protein VLJ16_00360 [Acidobacteriota bacterium]|nr:hypothetical protein [Acidobacteriota bacterium]